MFLFLHYREQKKGPQRRLEIHIGFEFPSIIRYLKPLTGDMFQARFADCQFDELVFPLSGEEKMSLPEGWHEITWNVPSLTHLDPCTNRYEQVVKMIIYL